MYDEDMEWHKREAEKRTVELANDLAGIRKSLYLTQTQVSDSLGKTTHANLSKIEQGKTIPRLDHLLRILSVYGYTIKFIKKSDV